MTYYDSLVKLYSDLRMPYELGCIQTAYENNLDFDLCRVVPCPLCPKYKTRDSEQDCWTGLVKAMDRKVPMSGAEGEAYAASYRSLKQRLKNEAKNEEYDLDD